MRRDVISNVQVVEPPLEELTKKKSGFKRGCLTGCGCVIIFIIGLIIFLRVATGPGPQTLKTVPASWPADIPVYDKDNIELITFVSGKYKNRSLEIAAFFPKIILSPLLLSTEGNATTTDRSLSNFWKIITTPVGDHRDTVQVEWRNLDAEPSFVISYYKKELIKKKFNIDVESEGQGVKQFSFSRADGVSGSLYTQGDEANRPGTDYAILTVNLPAVK